MASCGELAVGVGGAGGGVPAESIEGFEEHAGLAGGDPVGGETPDYFVDGVLEVLPAGGEGEVEAVTAAAAARFLGGLAGGVVEVAEISARRAGEPQRGPGPLEGVGAEGADVL